MPRRRSRWNDLDARRWWGDSDVDDRLCGGHTHAVWREQVQQVRCQSQVGRKSEIDLRSARARVLPAASAPLTSSGLAQRGARGFDHCFAAYSACRESLLSGVCEYAENTEQSTARPLGIAAV